MDRKKKTVDTGREGRIRGDGSARLGREGREEAKEATERRSNDRKKIEKHTERQRREIKLSRITIPLNDREREREKDPRNSDPILSASMCECLW